MRELIVSLFVVGHLVFGLIFWLKVKKCDWYPKYAEHKLLAVIWGILVIGYWELMAVVFLPAYFIGVYAKKRG